MKTHIKRSFFHYHLSVIYGLESPEDMLDTINTLTKECIDRHAPIRRVKVTRPPAPRIQSVEIRQLQRERDRLRAETRNTNNVKSWYAFRTVRNKIKTMISKARRLFLTNALSSERPKEVWQVIHQVLYPNPKPIRADPGELNKYFVSTVERTLGSKPDDALDLLNLVQSFSALSEQSSLFSLAHVTHEEVLKEISQLRSDSSTGHDQIPVRYIKFAKDYLAGPITHIINLCITSSISLNYD